MLGNFYKWTILQGYNAKQLNIQKWYYRRKALRLSHLNSGTYTVSSDDESSRMVSIDTGITVDGFIVQVYRAGDIS